MKENKLFFSTEMLEMLKKKREEFQVALDRINIEIESLEDFQKKYKEDEKNVS